MSRSAVFARDGKITATAASSNITTSCAMNSTITIVGFRKEESTDRLQDAAPSAHAPCTALATNQVVSTSARPSLASHIRFSSWALNATGDRERCSVLGATARHLAMASGPDRQVPGEHTPQDSDIASRPCWQVLAERRQISASENDRRRTPRERRSRSSRSRPQLASEINVRHGAVPARNYVRIRRSLSSADRASRRH